MKKKIPVYAINLKERDDRFRHISSQFTDRKEFELTIVEAVKNTVGALGLWQTIRNVTQMAIQKDYEYFILCEDDHEFTSEYNPEMLIRNVQAASGNNADLLLGGPSWISSFLPISEELYWVESFTGLQFTIIFKKFYQTILNIPFGDGNAADLRIGVHTKNKFFIYPYVSVQKFFGYSDATNKNNEEGRVEQYFVNCTENIKLINLVKDYYSDLTQGTIDNEELSFETIMIPTYIINLPKRTERKKHILEQFNGKREFQVTLVEACEHEIGAVGLWHSIRKVVKMAIQNDDDVIIICEDDHEFTEDYSRDFLIQNIIEGSQQGADFLSGGCGNFGSAVPVSRNRFWVSSVLSTQFIIVYRNLFHTILDEPFDDDVKADLLFSQLTSNKMLLYPFVSTQRDFGYSDVTEIHNQQEGLVGRMFETSRNRLSVIQNVFYNTVLKEPIVLDTFVSQ